MRHLLLAPLMLLAACQPRHDDPGAVSPEEDRLLNEAAASIEAPAANNTDQPALEGNQQ